MKYSPMKPLTFDGFSRINRLRCESPAGFNHPVSSWSSSDWLTAIMGELGEAANFVKKLNRIRDNIGGKAKQDQLSETELREALWREIADVFIYLDLFAQSLGLSVQEIIMKKFNETSEKVGYLPLIESNPLRTLYKDS